MKQKKHTVNERLALLERAFTILAGEVNAIVTAINMTVKDKDKSE
tara:strand:+ start:161 stop:295 length:135 start_codon:yes stop_codon:yes gene_type:complete